MRPYPLVAITGKRGHGKSTLAEVLTRRGYAHVNFADPLREACTTVYGVSMKEMLDPVLKETPLQRYPYKSPRELMQRIGTEMFRAYLDDTWVEAFRRSADAAIQAGAPGVVCSDCRFVNEASMIRAMGGRIIKVVDPRRTRNDLYSQHQSEIEIDQVEADWTIYNERTVADLHQAGEALLLDAISY
ncbi:deoxynucleotide monophosphate kinase [Brevundimonas phage vB_BpoS-Gurke]|uniref:Deoxynucleotide monophosphate kinase n=1 Tax=Brevundimonas phage vB_BpoS-Gurke TaxID=2948599 RepID=A0A9E7N3H4_9CAUD|nr:deoxynucleotide monophosphate kinase [Brevundimonas phage vB_BpoS-Gurke]